MTLFTFKLPDIGEGIAEAEIVTWHVKLGERVAEDQPVADMMTDKATVEIESPVAGIVMAVAGEVGDKVAIGSGLVVIETGEADIGAAAATAIADQPALVPRPVPLPTSAAAALRVPIDTALPAKILASPAVRGRARELGIDLARVRSEGHHIRHTDLDAYLRYGAREGYLEPHAARSWPDETVTVIGLRRRIAENMVAAKRSIPHFTYVEEVDVTALEAIRADLNAAYGDRPRLTVLPLLIVALCRSLPHFPMLNARYDDEAGIVIRSGRVHLGIATQTDAGLMVPVVRDAQDKNIWQLAAELARLAGAARSGEAKPEELSGSTLTLTSLGPLGGIATTPIINRPEVAIIGPNKIVERPVLVRNALGRDELRRAKLMNLSISCDHRVVDGWDAASFVQAMKARLETPVLLFAEEG